MKELTKIEMANDNDVYEYGFGNEIKIVESDNGFIVIPVDCDESDADYCDEFDTKNEALEDALAYALDEHIIVSGYGKYSGRKFWQLPEGLQTRIKLAVQNS